MKDFNIPTIYVIPKVQKMLTRPPGRTIISVVEDPLEQIGQYLDALMEGMVKELPSFFQDTRDVLLRIARVGVQEGAILASVDVESLYISIPQ